METIVHYTDKYLLDPTHPVTVNLVGCGGTGSQVLTKLAQLHTTLQKLNHPGLHIRVFDPDMVEEPNEGRQLFFKSDIGHPKASVLVSRVNRAFGLGWESYLIKYDRENIDRSDPILGANILITCVDTGNARASIGQLQKEFLKHRSRYEESYSMPFYWLDYGNSKDTGQVILGSQQEVKQPKSKFTTVGYLQTVLDMFPEIEKIDDEDNTPSCSTAQALNKQDLFTNAMIVPYGMQLLWKLFREARIEEQGAFINVTRLKSSPIKIKAA